MGSGQFVLDAWIMGDRWKHHRVRDHFGPENATYVVCDTPIGRFPPGTPIPTIIADMMDRLWWLDNATRHRGSFTLDAFIAASGTYGRGLFTVDAAIKSTRSGSFVLDAVIQKGGFFVLDARMWSRFVLDAFIV
jgi:hypothetical protein